ncbi:hypothetical protein P692DRAFT_20123319, partial [Suillus brevipes Sb2]
HLLHVRISDRRHDEVIEYSTERHQECAAIHVYQLHFKRNHQSSVACVTHQIIHHTPHVI